MAGFHDIIGHEKIKEHLQKAIGYQRVSHAYILSGEEGMGRKTIAKAFAMTLLCEKHGTEPCMECHSCKQFLSGNHPDVIWVTHEKPASIGVDDVRIQINDTVSIRPYSSPYKIYLVDEAEKMTVQAQNALLKTIEEPPAYAVLVLITTNPPYMNDSHGLKNPDLPKAIARHEVLCNLEDVVRAAASALRPGGRLYMVHRPRRLIEILMAMKSQKLEPKRMKFVHPFADKEANMVLIEAVRGGGALMTVEKPIIVYKEPGVYTDEIYDIYGY